jgi:hypothetical protein
MKQNGVGLAMRMGPTRPGQGLKRCTFFPAADLAWGHLLSCVYMRGPVCKQHPNSLNFFSHRFSFLSQAKKTAMSKGANKKDGDADEDGDNGDGDDEETDVRASSHPSNVRYTGREATTTPRSISDALVHCFVSPRGLRRAHEARNQLSSFGRRASV